MSYRNIKAAKMQNVGRNRAWYLWMFAATALSILSNQIIAQLPYMFLPISVVIPATFNDFQCFGESLLDYFRTNLTRKPSELIISISSVPESYLDELSGKLTERWKGVKFLLHKDNLNAAQNRNAGADVASKKLISFFDVDDIPHPDYFGAIGKIFAFNKVDAALVSIGETTMSEMHSVRFPRVEISRKLQPNCLPVYSEYHRSSTMYKIFLMEWDPRPSPKPVRWFCHQTRYKVAFGWPTISAPVAKLMKFNESLNVGEDGELASRLLRSGFQLTHWDIVLGLQVLKHDRSQHCPPASHAYVYNNDT